jgi:hypothetical protein
MRDFDFLFFLRQSAWLLSRLATYPFRTLRNDLRIRKAVREFDTVMRSPFAPVTDVWVCARSVYWAFDFARAPRRVASDIKRQTGNRILLWVLFPELGP